MERQVFGPMPPMVPMVFAQSRRPLRRLQCLPTSSIRFGILRSATKQSGVAS